LEPDSNTKAGNRLGTNETSAFLGYRHCKPFLFASKETARFNRR
jgi:hypothetical protein